MTGTSSSVPSFAKSFAAGKPAWVVRLLKNWKLVLGVVGVLLLLVVVIIASVTSVLLSKKVNSTILESDPENFDNLGHIKRKT
jgi:hypothetical protein